MDLTAIEGDCAALNATLDAVLASGVDLPAAAPVDAGCIVLDVPDAPPYSLRDVKIGMYQPETVLEHIRACAARGLPMIETAKYDGQVALVVAPGPSLDSPLVRERIRRLARKGAIIIGIKEALGLLVKMGVQPHYAVSVDPKADQVAKTPIVPGVTYLTASCCHPALFDYLLAAGADVRVFHSVTGVKGEEHLYASLFPQDAWGLWIAQTGLSVANRAIACAFRMNCEHAHLAGAPFGVRADDGETLRDGHLDIERRQLYAAGVRGTMPGKKTWATDHGRLDGRPWLATADMMVSAASVSKLMGHGLVSVIGDSLAKAFARRPDLRDASVQGVV